MPTYANSATTAKPRRGPRGFTLIELVIVILILGILAGVAAPKFVNISSDSSASATLSNVDAIFTAAELYIALNGSLPRETPPGDFPSEFADLLPESLFTNEHSLGGHFGWDGAGTSQTNFGVSLSVAGGVTPESTSFYQAMEEIADDGRAGTGWITVDGGLVRFRLQKRSTASDDIGIDSDGNSVNGDAGATLPTI